MTESIAPSPLELIQEHSLTSALKVELERMIFDGSVRVGERLNESTLAARFGTSRGPLREALQALGQILGQMTPDDLLGRIFSTFCIGK